MFYFKLQTLLDYKKQLEKKQTLEFATIKRCLDHEKEALKKVKQARTDLTAKLEKMGKGALCTADISVYLSYIHHMKEREDRQKEVVGKIEKELEAQRRKLINASRKRKIIETVRDKKLEEYRLDLICREQKELDEAGVLRTGKGVQIEKTDPCL